MAYYPDRRGKEDRWVLMPFMMAIAHWIFMLDPACSLGADPGFYHDPIQLYRSSACGLVMRRTDRQRHL